MDKIFNKNGCEKIDAKTLLNKKLFNTVKYAQATERFAN